MIVRIITVQVKAGAEKEFEELTEANHRGSLGESGVLRFDVLRDTDHPGLYYLYEAYADEAATLAHKETDHYHRWKEAVEPLMASPRTSVATTPVAPLDRDGWRSSR
jgi:(4S)-4-hydroxy-5-phosphonooxypentane-2,3-dione isomerase